MHEVIEMAGDGGSDLGLAGWYPVDRAPSQSEPARLPEPRPSDHVETARSARAAEPEAQLACQLCGKAYQYNPSKGNSKSLCGTCKTAQARERMKEKAIEYLGGRCRLCGYARCHAALNFHPVDLPAGHQHHEEPNAQFFGRSWDRIRDELAQFALLCSNCRAEILAGTTIPPRHVLVAQSVELGAEATAVAGSRPAQNTRRRRP